MAKKRKKERSLLWLILLLVVVYYILGPGSGGITAPPNEQPGNPDNDDAAIQVYYFDENQNPVEPDPGIQAFVNDPRYTGQELYYFYTTLTASLTGTAETTVRVLDVKAYDSTEALLATDDLDHLRFAWGGIFNEPFTLDPQGVDEHTWSPYGTTGARALADLERFKDTEYSNQPIKFEYELEGTWQDQFGINRSGRIYPYVMIEITESPGDPGGFNATVVFDATGMVDQCSSGEFADCGYECDLIDDGNGTNPAGCGSACKGTDQECQSASTWWLWPGCHYGDFYDNGVALNRPYTGLNEMSTSYPGKTWQELCTDGIDNDCDGMADKAGCTNCGGDGYDLTADPNCPECELWFRTNIDIVGAGGVETLDDYKSPNTWVVADPNGDMVFVPYGRYSGVTYTVSDTSGNCSQQCGEGDADFLSWTPTQAGSVCRAGGPFGGGDWRYVHVYMPDPDNPGTKCKKLVFDITIPTSCTPGSTCTSYFPEQPWAISYGSEVCDYNY